MQGDEMKKYIKNENPDDEGYLIESLDSQVKNTPDYEGYVSWAPKKVFESVYRES